MLAALKRRTMDLSHGVCARRLKKEVYFLFVQNAIRLLLIRLEV